MEVVEREDGVIELHPHVSVPADQAWFWTPEWQQGERRVDEHVAAGEIKVSRDVDQLLRDVESARSKKRTSRRR